MTIGTLDEALTAWSTRLATSDKNLMLHSHLSDEGIYKFYAIVSLQYHGWAHSSNPLQKAAHHMFSTSTTQRVQHAKTRVMIFYVKNPAILAIWFSTHVNKVHLNTFHYLMR